MNKCKSCLDYFPIEDQHKGTCIAFLDQNLIKQNSAIMDLSEDDFIPQNLQVGEDFGCIHWSKKPEL